MPITPSFCAFPTTPGMCDVSKKNDPLPASLTSGRHLMWAVTSESWYRRPARSLSIRGRSHKGDSSPWSLYVPDVQIPVGQIMSRSDRCWDSLPTCCSNLERSWIISTAGLSISWCDGSEFGRKHMSETAISCLPFTGEAGSARTIGSTATSLKPTKICVAGGLAG